jgi:NAD(P)-dependent dehydrogenase (short-subunit alcohol dehydrogenase family)
MQDLSGRVAVVTGAASGIGRGIVLALARAGMNTVASDVEESGAQAVAEEAAQIGPRSIGVGVDVTDAVAVQDLAAKTWAEFGTCHVLCNNAGVAVVRRAVETTADDWRWTLRVNLWGVVNGIEAFLPRMQQQGGPAHIVNTASMSGHLPTPGLGAYTASKYAVVGLSECLKMELAEDPIGVSVLCPGAVDTRIADAGRNRPAALGPGTSIDGTVRTTLASGMDPERAGEIVREGIEADEFWIFTHPQMAPAVAARQRGITKALERWKERT